ncbi:MAG: hypothetical protein NTU53_02765 [Planctomycetota bacterium]|nr:hypothetical protein [Planctomycetota bacterium]
MKRIATGLLTVLIGLGGASCGAKLKMPELTMPKMLQPDPPEVKVQNQIAVVLKADDDVRFYREVSNLLELSGKVEWDTGRLLKEVMDYMPRIENDDQLGRFQRMLELMRVPKSALVDAAGARLGAAQGKEATVCRTMLRAAAPADPRGAADFSQFTQYLTARQMQLPQGLVLWMYDRDPAAAMEQMMGIFGSRMAADDVQTLVIGARVLDQMRWKVRYGLATEKSTDELVIQQLEKLAGFEQWWVRLYVAEMLAKHPQVRRAGLVAKLANDIDPLVAYVMGPVVAKQ